MAQRIRGDLWDHEWGQGRDGDAAREAGYRIQKPRLELFQCILPQFRIGSEGDRADLKVQANFIYLFIHQIFLEHLPYD